MQSDTFSHIGSSLRLYVQLFEFNAGPYLLLKQIGFVVTGTDVSKMLGPALGVGYLFAVAVLFLRVCLRPVDHTTPIASIGLILLGGYLFATTTVHPWYVLMPLALSPFVFDKGSPAMKRWAWGWWWFGLFATGTYGFYVGEHTLALSTGVLGWLVLLVATLGAVAVSSPIRNVLNGLLERRGRSKWKWVASVLQVSSASIDSSPRLLDLGAGEGWVGWAAQDATYADVQLADVVDLNETPLPHIEYDGERLPLDGNQFDIVLLVFVLHHTQEPDAVLREARRVVRDEGVVVVLESVYSNQFNHKLLRFLDTQANRLRGEGEMIAQEEHLAFDTVQGWRSRFASLGLDVVAEDARGRWVHQQHLFVLRPLV
ncbi:MAG: class I SAM-dependent methyltransferase [Bacteroidota bacterium]